MSTIFFIIPLRMKAAYQIKTLFLIIDHFSSAYTITVFIAFKTCQIQSLDDQIKVSAKPLLKYLFISSVFMTFMLLTLNLKKISRKRALETISKVNLINLNVSFY